MTPRIGNTIHRLVRALIGGWLLACLPLGLWLFLAINNSLLQQDPGQRQIELELAARNIERLLNQTLHNASTQKIYPADLSRAIMRELPQNFEGAWLKNPEGQFIPCSLNNSWSADASRPRLTSPPTQTLWAPMQLAQSKWELGIHFEPGTQSLHPLAFSLFLAGALSLGLMTLIWHQWGRQHRVLQQTTERFHQTLDYAGDALFYVTPGDGRIAQVNPQGASMLGYSQDEIATLKPEDLFDRQARKRFFRLVSRVRKKGYGEEKNLLFRRKDGSTFFGAVHARLGKLGKRPMVHGVLRDVTPARQLEKELRQKNQELRLLNRIAHLLAETRESENGLNGVLEVVRRAFQAGGGGIYLVRNQDSRLELVATLNLDEASELAIRELDPRRSVIGQVVVTGQPYGSPDITQHPLLASATVLDQGWRSLQAVPLTSQAEIIGVLFLFDEKHRAYTPEELQLLMAVGHQIGATVSQSELVNALRWQSRLTQASNRELERSRKQLRNHLSRLEDSNRTLEQLDRMKNNFLAIASHELRTPLTYILPAVELLEDKLAQRDEETRDLLGSILQGGKRLDRLVQDLLEMARIESRDIYLARERIDLNQALLQLEQQFAPALEERCQILNRPQVPPHLDLHGDSHHLYNALSRLMENAVKFTPDHGVIAIELAEIERQVLLSNKEQLLPFSPGFFDHPLPSQLLQLTVRDTGVGIDPDQCLRIFDKFYNTGDIREHFSSTTRFGGKGVGIGLTLVKGMIEIQGGMIWVESHHSGLQTGTAFHIILPLPDPADGLHAPH